MYTEPTVYIVDDDAAVRLSLRLLLETAGFRVVTFTCAADFLLGYQPDVLGCLVLDVCLPDRSGLDLQRQLVTQGVSLPVIMVTGYGDVPTAVRALRDGAIDFIEKPYDDEVLLSRIRQAVDVDLRHRRERIQRQQILARIALLTPRERDVLDGVVNGLANKQIAHGLGISPKTVEGHRANVMEKMRVDSLAELVTVVQNAGALRARTDPARTPAEAISPPAPPASNTTDVAPGPDPAPQKPSASLTRDTTGTNPIDRSDSSDPSDSEI